MCGIGQFEAPLRTGIGGERRSPPPWTKSFNRSVFHLLYAVHGRLYRLQPFSFPQLLGRRGVGIERTMQYGDAVFYTGSGITLPELREIQYPE